MNRDVFERIENIKLIITFAIVGLILYAQSCIMIGSSIEYNKDSEAEVNAFTKSDTTQTKK